VWRVDYEKPMRTGCKQGEMNFNCFYLQAKIGTAPATKQESRTAVSSKFFSFREAGMQVSPVTMSHRP
jgi:hypothetical protein